MVIWSSCSFKEMGWTPISFLLVEFGLGNRQLNPVRVPLRNCCLIFCKLEYHLGEGRYAPLNWAHICTLCESILQICKISWALYSWIGLGNHEIWALSLVLSNSIRWPYAISLILQHLKALTCLACFLRHNNVSVITTSWNGLYLQCICCCW